MANKYFQEFISQKDKNWIEIPGNLIICIDLKSMEWDCEELIDGFFTNEK